VLEIGNRVAILCGAAQFCIIVARFYEAWHNFGCRKYFLLLGICVCCIIAKTNILVL